MMLLTPLPRPVLLSTLWIVLLFNYLYCDVLGLYDPAHLVDLETGTLGGGPFTPGKLVAAGVLMQIPIAMVLLARVVRHGLNRWINVGAASVMAAVQVSTLFLGTPPTPVYLLFSAIEITLLLAIVVLAASWTRSRERAAHDRALAGV